MRRSFIPLSIAAACVLCLFLGWRLFGGEAIERYKRVAALRRQTSDIRLSMTVRYAHGAITEETYRMTDRDGVSAASYRVIGRSGTIVHVDGLPYASYDVSSFFGRTVQDGIWELRDKPPRGDLAVAYVITIAQTADGRSGAHAMRFTDPRYWATTAGRLYRIRLEKDKPVSDMIFMNGASIAEPRYERLVQDFRAFGSDALHEKIAQARRTATRTSDR